MHIILTIVNVIIIFNTYLYTIIIIITLYIIVDFVQKLLEYITATQTRI